LCGFDLCGVDFCGFDLRCVDFCGVDLCRAKLQSALLLSPSIAATKGALKCALTRSSQPQQIRRQRCKRRARHRTLRWYDNSHPAGISSRAAHDLARRRGYDCAHRSAQGLLMLKPKRLCGNSLARKKNCEVGTRAGAFQRGRQHQFLAPHQRASRGNDFPCPLELAVGNGLPNFRGEPMASLLRRAASTCGHPFVFIRTRSVRLGASAFARGLNVRFGQTIPLCSTRSAGVSFTRNARTAHCLFSGWSRI